MIDRLLLVLHVGAAVLFVGNIAVGLFWTTRALHNRETRVLGHTFTSLNAADAWLTTPSVLLLTMTGIALAIRMRFPLMGTGWILWSVIALSLSGVIFVARVLPLQKRIARAWEEAMSRGASVDPRSHTARWSRWAHLSLLLAVVALILMVAKPILPALGS